VHKLCNFNILLTRDLNMTEMQRKFEKTVLNKGFRRPDATQIIREQLEAFVEELKLYKAGQSDIGSLEEKHDALEGTISDNRRSLNRFVTPKSNEGLGDSLMRSTVMA
jgi:hypothetical protein